MILRLFPVDPNSPLNKEQRATLVIIVDVLIAIVVLLLFFGLAFQVYAFNKYREDVRQNRILLCAIETIKDSTFCVGVPSSPLAIREAEKATKETPQ